MTAPQKNSLVGPEIYDLVDGFGNALTEHAKNNFGDAYRALELVQDIVAGLCLRPQNRFSDATTREIKSLISKFDLNDSQGKNKEIAIYSFAAYLEQFTVDTSPSIKLDTSALPKLIKGYLPWLQTSNLSNIVGYTRSEENLVSLLRSLWVLAPKRLVIIDPYAVPWYQPDKKNRNKLLANWNSEYLYKYLFGNEVSTTNASTIDIHVASDINRERLRIWLKDSWKSRRKFNKQNKAKVYLHIHPDKSFHDRFLLVPQAKVGILSSYGFAPNLDSGTKHQENTHITYLFPHEVDHLYTHFANIVESKRCVTYSLT